LSGRKANHPSQITNHKYNPVMPVALLGGTFDPIHKGHLAIAQAALEDARFALERIVFIPADIPPHKQEVSITPYAHRFAMLELALKDHPRFELSPMEDPAETKGEPNYSINTVRRFKRERHLETENLYFIVGIDSFEHIGKWREPQALMAECRLIVAHRPGYEPPKGHPDVAYIEDVSVDVSSTMIRSAVTHREPLEKYVVPAVADYIVKHRLYR
jgi:nicotinate-nucleotide adenylyltransferase